MESETRVTTGIPYSESQQLQSNQSTIQTITPISGSNDQGGDTVKQKLLPTRKPELARCYSTSPAC